MYKDRNTYKLDLNPKLNNIKETIVAPTAVVSKGWGREDGIGEIFAYHEPQEFEKLDVKTVKVLHIGQNLRLSRHLHLEKDEYFFIACGKIKVEIWDKNGDLSVIDMREDDKIFIPHGTQHRMTGVDKVNILVEISTLDKPEDSIRIERGD